MNPPGTYGGKSAPFPLANVIRLYVMAWTDETCNETLAKYVPQVGTNSSLHVYFMYLLTINDANGIVPGSGLAPVLQFFDSIYLNKQL